MKKNSVLLITSAQVDLMNAEGKAWGLTKDSIIKNNVKENLVKLQKSARELGIPIIHSPVGIDFKALKDFNPLTAIQKIIFQNKLLDIDNTGTSFIKEALPEEQDIVLEHRTGFSSFWPNLLQPELQKLDVETIYIAGMLAEGCVESHARDAAENGFRPIVISDAVGSTSLELLEASMKTIGLHTDEILTTDQTVVKWKN